VHPVLASQYKNDINKLEQVQWGAPRCSGPGALALWGNLRDQGLFSLEKRWLQGDLAVACLYLQGGHQANGARLFAAECGRTWNSRHKPKQERIRLVKGKRTGIRKKIPFPL